jgi:uncharacterized protein YndB with AHSA1/START domain
MSTNSTPIVVEQILDAPIAAVWKAITDPAEMSLWFFEEIADFEPVVGFETEFVVETEGRTFPHLWRVIAVVPEARIAYDWRYGGYPGESIVTWELTETPDGTSLKLTHSGIETFPQNDPVFRRESGVAGWRYFLRQSLPAFLARSAS